MNKLTAHMKLLLIKSLHNKIVRSENKYIVLKVKNQLGKEFGSIRIKSSDFLTLLRSQRAKIVKESDNA